MTCHDCTQATERRGQWHGYFTECRGCRARAVARSQAAFMAVRQDKPHELLDMLERVLPDVPLQEARRMVWSWWQTDHENEGAPA